MMGLRFHNDFISTCLISMVLRLCVLVVSVTEFKYVSACFAADPDSTAVQPFVAPPVDSTVVDSLRSPDPAMVNPSGPGFDPSTTLK